jgi:hypothetical protein
MSDGLDFTEVRYETDHAGNRLKATIPYAMFSALTEFWIAARRAQTAKIEATAKPGQYKGALSSIASGDEPPAVEPPAPHSGASLNPHDRHWNNLIARMPVEPIAAPIPNPPRRSKPPNQQQPRKPPSSSDRRGANRGTCSIASSWRSRPPKWRRRSSVASIF